MLYDHIGRAIARRKQYGLTRGPDEYALVVTPREITGADEADAIGSAFLLIDEDEDE